MADTLVRESPAMARGRHRPDRVADIGGIASPAGDVSAASGLFGRGMVYVLVWSLQLLAASVVSPVLAHLLDTSSFGYLATAISLYQVLCVVMVFGLDQSAVIEYSEGGARRIRAPRVLLLGALMSAGLTLVVLATGSTWAPAAGFPHFGGIVVLAVLWSAPGAVNLVVLALLRAQDRLAAFVVVNLISSLGGQVGGVCVLLAGHRSATAYGWAGVVAQYVALLIGLTFVWLRTRSRSERPLPPDREWTGRVLRVGAAMMASALAMFLLNSGDRVLLQRMLGADAVARYQVAYILGSVPVLLLTFLNQAWLPRILEIPDRDRQRRVLTVSRDWLLVVVAPALCALVVAAPLLMRIFAPANYHVDALLPVVFWVAVSALPVADCAASTRALVARRRTGPVAGCTALAAVVNIGVNLVLIPVWHITGAAVATFIAFVVQAVAARICLRADALRAPAPGVWLALLAALALAAAVTVLAPNDHLPAVRLAGAAALGALALVGLLRAARSDL